MTLSISNLQKMRIEFFDAFKELFKVEEKRLKRLRLQQLRAVEACKDSMNIRSYYEAKEVEIRARF